MIHKKIGSNSIALGATELAYQPAATRATQTRRKLVEHTSFDMSTENTAAQQERIE